MNEKRVFIGSFIKHSDLYELFDQVKKDLKNTGVFKWTKTYDNLHITFHFLGKTSIEQIEQIKSVLASILEQKLDLSIKISGINFFEYRYKPSILYAQISDKAGQLEKIYYQIQKKLFKEGIIEQINSHFVPHITLGRIKKVSPMFYEVIQKVNSQNIDIQIDVLFLEIIESILLSDGAEYKQLKK